MVSNLEKFISNTCCNSCQAFYDSYVEANVRFRSRLGMKQVIIRRQLGNCCNWCANLAGIYEVDKAPDDIYKRHRNCRCLVTYKSDNSGYQDVYSKKVFSTQREARIERLEQIQIEKEKRAPFDLERMKAKNNGEKYYDATKEWESLSNSNKLIIKEKESVTINGAKYVVDDKHVYINLEKYEKDTIESFAKKYGGIVQYCPVVQRPEGIKTPDFFYNGNKIDLKTFGIDNPGVKNKNAFTNCLQKERVKRQASMFILDYGRTGLTDTEALKQAERVFNYEKTSYVQAIILMKNNDVIKVLERI